MGAPRNLNLIHNGVAPVDVVFGVRDAPVTLAISGLSASESAALSILINEVDPTSATDADWLAVKFGGRAVTLTGERPIYTFSDAGIYRLEVPTGGASATIKVAAYVGSNLSPARPGRMDVRDVPDKLVMVSPEVSSSATGRVVIDGASATGSQHIIIGTDSLSDVLVEMVKLDFDSADDVRKVVVSNVNAVGAPTTLVRMTVDPGDDVVAATRLLNGYPDVETVLPDETVEVAAAAAITAVYVIGLAGQDSTATDCAATLFVRGFGNG